MKGEGMLPVASALASFFKGKKVLVTGHTGFKGVWLTAILLRFGADVAGYALPPNTSPSMYPVVEARVRNHLQDIRDYSALRSVFEKETPELVFHLAAQPLVRDSYDDPLYTYSTNVMGTANLLECVRQTKSVRSVVVVTTDKVYENRDGSRAFVEGDPLGGHDPYGTSKVCAEFVTRSYNLSYFSKGGPAVATARAGNVIGGGDWSKDRIVPDMVRAIFEKKGELVLRNPASVRPWQHVLDPLFGYLLLAKRLYEKGEGAAGAWNFAPGKENFITVEELVKKSLMSFGTGSYSISKDDSKHEMRTLRLDASKASSKLGWAPVLGMDECISWTTGWYKAFYSGSDPAVLSARQIDDFLSRLKYG